MNPFTTLSPQAFAIFMGCVFAFACLMLAFGYVIGAFCVRCKAEDEKLDIADRAFHQGRATGRQELIRERERTSSQDNLNGIYTARSSGTNRIRPLKSDRSAK